MTPSLRATKGTRGRGLVVPYFCRQARLARGMARAKITTANMPENAATIKYGVVVNVTGSSADILPSMPGDLAVP